MSLCERTCGYLDVKISSKSRRGFTPWKAWQKQWCEIKRVDSIENGLELKLKSSREGNTLNCTVLSRSSTICRTESRTKQYAFGVFDLGRAKKPILFLCGSSESDSQEWMFSIRKMLSVASYIPVTLGNTNFRISLVDNRHSRTAGFIGLHGVLSTNQREITISDPCTGELKISWTWFQFHQFHLQAQALPVDNKKVIVMHTSSEFSGGPGQLFLYCDDGTTLLDRLISRGDVEPKLAKKCKRLSRSEGDLCSPFKLDGPVRFRSQTGSDDSGVRVSIASAESEYVLQSKIADSLGSIGIVTKTPGGSETDDSSQDLAAFDHTKAGTKHLPRNESGISLSSGIYEEIPDDGDKKPHLMKFMDHLYENPIELIMECKRVPPPLPPRRPSESRDSINFSPYKHRCYTMPAKDLSKISQTFTPEPDYVVMSPGKSRMPPAGGESIYLPMSPVVKCENRRLGMGT